MPSELLACPFCSDEAAMIPVAFPQSIRFAVECENHGCHVRTPAFATEAEAIAAWNTRPQPTDEAREGVANTVHDLVGEAYLAGYNDGSADARHEEGLDADAMHEGCAQFQADARERIAALSSLSPDKEPNT